MGFRAGESVLLVALARQSYTPFMAIPYSPALVSACWAMLYLA